MAVLTIASGKGGVGKTLAAISLTAAMAAEGIDVALLDADPNRGAHRWVTGTYSGASPLAAYAEADTERLANLVPELANRHLHRRCGRRLGAGIPWRGRHRRGPEDGRFRSRNC